MTPSKVFIASSSEGLEVERAVRALLLDALRDRAELRPWTREFDLSATYIESLEKAAEEADFAILVVTPDDVTISRDKKKAAPRDNVVFELGLFMGCLGRERCFIVNEERPDLKVPSDLLGVHSASFKRREGRDLKSALDAACLSISERIENLGARYKLPREIAASQAALRSFCESLEGTWWERVCREGMSALSFCRIEPDVSPDAVVLSGRGYDLEGHHAANWNSVIARADMETNRILYHWQGWHTLAELANVPFHGFGEIQFDRPLRSGDAIVRGTGKFWNVDESHPEKTIVKPTELRRVTDARCVSTMLGGTGKAIRSLVRKTLSEW
jgi:hypothetical protein